MKYDDFIEQLKGKGEGYIFPNWAFVARCFINERDRYEQTVNAAENIDSAITAISGHPDRIASQAYAELAKVERWPLAAKDSDENLVLISDAGGVLVGDVAGTCGTIIPNGYGDGETEVLIYTDPKRVNLHQLEYWGILRGEWKIYEYDCAELSPATEGSLVVAGKTEAYYGEGTVALIAGEHEWR